MSDIDELIRKRLENLRADGTSNPAASTSSALPKIVKKSAPEQVEDLLSKLNEEANLQKKEKERSLDIDSQIRVRLERLKSREGCDFFAAKTTSIPKSASKEELADDDFFNSSSCTELLADLGGGSDKDSLSGASSASETLCGICDENIPSVICIDCDKDYYCHKCFKEYHSDDEVHKTVPYANK